VRGRYSFVSGGGLFNTLAGAGGAALVGNAYNRLGDIGESSQHRRTGYCTAGTRAGASLSPIQCLLAQVTSLLMLMVLS
jgi:hypothetical protein